MSNVGLGQHLHRSSQGHRSTELASRLQRLAGRAAPGNPQVWDLLCALTACDDRTSQDGLAQVFSVPSLRISGIVSVGRRVLNLDQAQVLAMDGDDVVLDERLLRVQFQLKDEA